LKPYAHAFPTRRLEIETFPSTLYGLIIMSGLNIVLRRILFFLLCMLLVQEGTGSDTFSVDGWRNWNIGGKTLLKQLDVTFSHDHFNILYAFF
jgi:hypothetical protein